MDVATSFLPVLQVFAAERRVSGRVLARFRLHAPPAPRLPGQTGHPRLRGAHLLTPQEMLPQKGLRRLRLKRFAGRADQIRVATQVCRFFKAPGRDVLVIAVQYLRGGRGTEVFCITDVTTDVETVL